MIAQFGATVLVELERDPSRPAQLPRSIELRAATSELDNDDRPLVYEILRLREAGVAHVAI